MEYFKDDFQWSEKAAKPLKIIIVGAGIGGLSAAIGLKKSGHDVVILEQVTKIAEVGAGIQLAPNNCRIMGRWGILEKVLEYTTLLERNSLRRWKNDAELGTAPLMPGIGEKYGAPLGVIHRGDLQRVLLESAQEVGVDIRTGHRVVRVDDEFEARAQLKNGEWVEGDVIIAADGIKSDIRRQIAASHEHTDRATPTGDAAYRILIPKEKLEGDEEAMQLLHENIGRRWMGPDGHIMAYPIKNNTVYNMVLLHPQKPGSKNDESWTRKGDKQEMLDFYKEWCPIVNRLLEYVPPGDVMEWTLNSHKPLPSWVENKVALIGDACHPMLPYVAQGAAQAMEDGAVLETCFAKTSDVPLALGVYEVVRKARGEAIQQSAATTRRALHLPDGPEQEERDRKISEASRGQGENPDKWADSTWQSFMWQTDDTWENWEQYRSRAEGHHVADLNAVAYT